MQFNFSLLNCTKQDTTSQVRPNCSALSAISGLLSGIHDTLSITQNRLTRTVASLYSLSASSLDHPDVARYVLVRNLQYRLDLSKAFEQLIAYSVHLDARVLSYRSYLEELDKDSELGIIDPMSEHFRQNLLVARDQQREILLSFMLVLCRTLFLNIALAFSNQLLKIGDSNDDFQGLSSVATLSRTIDETNELLRQLGRTFNESFKGSLESILKHFLSVVDAAIRSAKSQDQDSFDSNFSESEHLSRAFVQTTSILL